MAEKTITFNFHENAQFHYMSYDGGVVLCRVTKVECYTNLTYNPEQPVEPSLVNHGCRVYYKNVMKNGVPLQEDDWSKKADLLSERFTTAQAFSTMIISAYGYQVEDYAPVERSKAIKENELLELSNKLSRLASEIHVKLSQNF